jgi:hypothetical protein
MSLDARDALIAYNAGAKKFAEGRAPVESFEYADQILGCARLLGLDPLTYLLASGIAVPSQINSIRSVRGKKGSVETSMGLII